MDAFFWRLHMMKNFTKVEKKLWCFSMEVLLGTYILFPQNNILVLMASMIGITSLIFNAKGNPIGQCLMIIFSVMYGYVSWTFSYYGEMMTYLAMTAPMSIFALISWLKHPYQGNKQEVEVYQMKFNEYVWMIVWSIVVTGIFYVILKAWHTSSLFWSTVSITTSFIAVYLTYKRSAYYAIGYAMNDVILIILWTIVAFKNINDRLMVVCFSLFLMMDIYGFIQWKHMRRKQGGIENESINEKKKAMFE